MSCVWSAALSDIPRRKPDKNCAGGASVLCGVARWSLAMVGPVGDVKPRLGLAPSLCCPTNTLLVIFLAVPCFGFDFEYLVSKFVTGDFRQQLTLRHLWVLPDSHPGTPGLGSTL